MPRSALLKPLFYSWKLAGRFQVTRSEPTWAGEGQKAGSPGRLTENPSRTGPSTPAKGGMSGNSWASEIHPCVFPPQLTVAMCPVPQWG